jgi:mRNA interferase RelE/StbE
MPWDCKFDKSALKDLQKIPSRQQKRLLQAITILSKDPYRKNNKIKRLSGSLSDYYRLRIGDYRVLYLLEQDSQTMFVKAVLRRNEKTYK